MPLLWTAYRWRNPWRACIGLAHELPLREEQLNVPRALNAHLGLPEAYGPIAGLNEYWILSAVRAVSVRSLVMLLAPDTFIEVIGPQAWPAVAQPMKTRARCHVCGLRDRAPHGGLERGASP